MCLRYLRNVEGQRSFSWCLPIVSCTGQRCELFLTTCCQSSMSPWSYCSHCQWLPTRLHLLLCFLRGSQGHWHWRVPLLFPLCQNVILLLAATKEAEDSNPGARVFVLFCYLSPKKSLIHHSIFYARFALTDTLCFMLARLWSILIDPLVFFLRRIPYYMMSLLLSTWTLGSLLIKTHALDNGTSLSYDASSYILTLSFFLSLNGKAPFLDPCRWHSASLMTPWSHQDQQATCYLPCPFPQLGSTYSFFRIDHPRPPEGCPVARCLSRWPAANSYRRPLALLQSWPDTPLLPRSP